MTFQVNHEFLIIGKDAAGFSKNYFYEWDDGLGGHKSRLFLNFHSPSAKVEGSEVGDALFDVMKNYFFHDLGRAPGDRFEDMLKEMNVAIKAKEEELGIEYGAELNVIAAVIVKNQLYLSQHGEAEAYLIRRRYVSTVSEGLYDPKNEAEVFQNIANGELAAGDYVLFCSTRLIRYITKSDLGRLLSGGAPLQLALDAISDAVAVDLMDRMSILGIQIGEREEVVIEADETDEAKNDLDRRSAVGPSRFSRLGDSLKLKWGRLIPSRPARATRPARSDEAESLSEEPVESNVDDESRVERKMDAPLSQVSHVLREWRELKRDKILIALVAVVVVLLVGIYLVRHQGQKQHLIEELEGKLSTVELNINTARTTGSYDKASATELLNEAEGLALDVLNSGYLRGKASEFLSEIETQRDRLDNVVRIEVPDVFVDFSVTNPAMNARGMVRLGDHFYVYEHDKLYEIILDEIQEPVVIDENEVVVDAAYFDDRDSIVFLTQSNRVIEYENGNFSFVDTSDSAWQTGNEIAVYNGRIYFLDGKQGQIWRYYPERDGFSGADPYVTDTLLDLKGARSFTIDGSVFVLDEMGEVKRLLSGEVVENFAVRKSPTTDLAGAMKIYTEFEMFQFFVLDPANSRVLVYNKDARSGDLVYNAQYILENAEELRDIYVDKEASRLYVVGKTKVYELTY